MVASYMDSTKTNHTADWYDMIHVRGLDMQIIVPNKEYEVINYFHDNQLPHRLAHITYNAIDRKFTVITWTNKKYITDEANNLNEVARIIANHI